MNQREAARMRALARCGAGLLAAVITAAAAQARPALDWHTPWAERHDSAAAAERSDEYAWRLFIALNWAADPRARAADRRAPFGAARPSVWETWQNAGDVYLPDGNDPGPWTSGDVWAQAPSQHRFETFSLKDLPNARHIVDGRMAPLTDAIADASRLTEIRMNRVAFDYIRARELYNVEGQLRAVGDGRGVSFPNGAVEVKAKWRPIRAEERERYHTIELRLSNGSMKLYGLCGLHIVSKDLPQWFWATFEHVDNATLKDGDGWRLPSRDQFACRGEAADCGRAPTGIGLEDTVWRYYRLRGTLTSFVDAADRPLKLANSELEAGLQESSSCMTCHSRSSIGRLAGEAVRLPIFDVAVSDPIERRGFVGTPRAEWFLGTERGAPVFQPLDFVWSLSKAQSKRGST